MAEHTRGNRIKLTRDLSDGRHKKGDEAVIDEVRDASWMFPYLVKFDDGSTLPVFRGEIAKAEGKQ